LGKVNQSVEAAPCSDQLFVNHDGLLDAGALTPFVGLVRHLRRAWTENDSRNTAEGRRQRRCVGEIGRRLD
jgi:hypothetical protein